MKEVKVADKGVILGKEEDVKKFKKILKELEFKTTYKEN